MDKTFRCQIVTPEGMVLDRDVTAAVVPIEDGMIGILPNHAPLMAAAGKGFVRVRTDGQTFMAEISEGFVEVRDNVMTVLAERTSELMEIPTAGLLEDLHQGRQILEQKQAS